jgi:tetratricopeptide (TPR) repeat protein
MKVQLLFLATSLTVLLASGPVGAQTIVTLGKGYAHDCFIYAKAGTDPFDGVEVCNQALKDEVLTTKDRAATYDNRGVMLDLLGKTEKAADDFHMASALNESLGDPHVNLGSMMIKERRYSDALTEINKGLQLGMSFPHIGYYDRAIAEEMTGSYKEAYYDYKKVLEIEPDYAPATERLKDFIVTTTPAPAKSPS